MIIVQTILITPIIAALSRQIVEDLFREYDELFRSLSVPTHQAMAAVLWDARYSLITVALAGFGMAIAEVGAVMIVGGNIDHLTRVMTTAIALETSKGDLALALAIEANRCTDPPSEAPRALAEAAYAPGTRCLYKGHSTFIRCLAIREILCILHDTDKSQSPWAFGRLSPTGEQ